MLKFKPLILSLMAVAIGSLSWIPQTAWSIEISGAQTRLSDLFWESAALSENTSPTESMQNASSDLAAILPGFMSVVQTSEWNQIPIYPGFGPLPAYSVPTSPFENQELVKEYWDPSESMFMPSTYFDGLDSDGLIKNQELEVEVGTI